MNFISKEIVACLSCLAPNDRFIDFCEKCGSPVGMTSTLDPLKTIQAEGFLFRKATTEKPKVIVLLGFWILFLPWLIATSMISVHLAVNGKDSADFIFFVFAVALTFVGIRMLFPVTWNYLTMPEPRKQNRVKRKTNTVLILSKTGFLGSAAILFVSWLTQTVGTTYLFWFGLLTLFVSFPIWVFVSNRQETKSFKVNGKQ